MLIFRQRRGHIYWHFVAQTQNNDFNLNSCLLVVVISPVIVSARACRPFLGVLLNQINKGKENFSRESLLVCVISSNSEIIICYLTAVFTPAKPDISFLEDWRVCGCLLSC